MNDVVKNLLLLIKSALTNEKQSIDKDVSWHDLFVFASAHRITTLLYYGIKNCGAELSADISDMLKTKLYKSATVSAQNDYQLELLFSELDAQGIEYMPTKGLVVRELYPKADMRTVGDADILVHPEKIVLASKVLESLGYEFVKESTHEHVWQKKHTKIELHKKLIGDAFPEYSEYYSDTASFFDHKDENGRYTMSLDDLLVYLIVHIAKHYRNGGIGIRHFIDIYVIRRMNKLDDDYITKELSKMKLEKFYRTICDLLDVWFEGKTHTEATVLMAARVCESGIFGNRTNISRAKAANTKKKNFFLSKVFSAIFLPYENMKGFYPTLEKAPALLPFFWVKRIFDRVFFKRERVKRFAHMAKMSTKSEAHSFKNELEAVGFYNIG